MDSEDHLMGDSTATGANPTYDSSEKAKTYGSFFDNEAFWEHVDDYSLRLLLGDLTDKSVLDIGCGEGRICRKLLLWHPLKRMVGMDYSQYCIEQARKSSDERIEYIQEDAMKGVTVGDSESFDVILTVYVIQYAKNYEQMLGLMRTAYNNLKPGGRFVGIFSAYSPIMDLKGYNQFFKSHYEWTNGKCAPFGPIHCLMLNGDKTDSLDMQIYAIYPEIFQKAIKIGSQASRRV